MNLLLSKLQNILNSTLKSSSALLGNLNRENEITSKTLAPIKSFIKNTLTPPVAKMGNKMKEKKKEKTKDKIVEKIKKEKEK